MQATQAGLELWGQPSPDPFPPECDEASKVSPAKEHRTFNQFHAFVPRAGNKHILWSHTHDRKTLAEKTPLAVNVPVVLSSKRMGRNLLEYGSVWSVKLWQCQKIHKRLLHSWRKELSFHKQSQKNKLLGAVGSVAFSPFPCFANLLPTVLLG